MEEFSIRKKLLTGYGIGFLVVVIPLIIATAFGSGEVFMRFLANNPMVVVDVIIMAALLGSVMIHYCLAEEYQLHFSFCMERKLLYRKRSRVLRVCRIASTALALSYKLFLVIGTGELDGVGMGRILLYGIAIGIVYAGILSVLLFGLDLIPMSGVVVIYVVMPFLLFFVSVSRVQIPLLHPTHTLAAILIGVLVCVLATYMGTVHKKCYMKMDY